MSGCLVLTHLTGNRWAAGGGGAETELTAGNAVAFGGLKQLTAELDRVQFATSGSNTFNNGYVRIGYA
jgi:hypothetical protein